MFWKSIISFIKGFLMVNFSYEKKLNSLIEIVVVGVQVVVLRMKLVIAFLLAVDILIFARITSYYKVLVQ